MIVHRRIWFLLIPSCRTVLVYGVAFKRTPQLRWGFIELIKRRRLNLRRFSLFLLVLFRQFVVFLNEERLFGKIFLKFLYISFLFEETI